MCNHYVRSTGSGSVTHRVHSIYSPTEERGHNNNQYIHNSIYPPGDGFFSSGNSRVNIFFFSLQTLVFIMSPLTQTVKVTQPKMQRNIFFFFFPGAFIRRLNASNNQHTHNTVKDKVWLSGWWTESELLCWRSWSR